VTDITFPVRRRASILASAPGSVRTTAAALVTEAGEVLSHGELRARVAGMARHLPDVALGRRLVHLPMGRDAASVLAYLATLEAGHVALVTPAGEGAAAVVDRYRPDVTATGAPERPFAVETPEPRHLLHPDLALLLSTSGSTGSPKLVRLSDQNLHDNATAIAAALGITAADRAISSLPLHYCFGLSVLHSHLVAGGSVVLHEGSVLDASFWDAVDGRGVTTLAVVPHMVELMETTGVLEREHPSLRLVAQAGGRMSPERILRMAALGREHGWGLSVMYGQTEATARICVLDPALVAGHPESVGRPVAGTTLHLDTTVPEAADGAGEVVVRGPGVMMGYADHPDDLALGPLLTELRTGDLGRIGPDGLLRLVGRRSGFVKVMGVRIDVARVEGALEAAGIAACVGGADDGLTVVVEPQPDRPDTQAAAKARTVAGQASGLGPAAVLVAVAELPRLPNGKVNRPGSAALVRAEHQPDAGTATHVPDAGPTPPAVTHTATRTDPAAQVAGVVGQVLGRDAVDLGRTFVQLGGDSLSHVRASVQLEAVVGPLPRGWHHRPLTGLVDLARSRRAQSAAASPHDGRGGRGRRAWRTVETTVLLRALAVVAICGSHADLFDVMGGAHILLAVAGFNTAGFGLSVPSVAGRWRSSARILVGVAVPTMAVALIGMLATARYGWSNVLLMHWLIGQPVAGSTRNEFWFIDALLASILVITALLSVPVLARAWRRDPWRVAAGFTALALVPRFLVPPLTDSPLEQSMLPTTLWLFGAGAAAAYANTPTRRGITLALAVVGGTGFFPGQPVRDATVLLGLAVLVLVPHVRLPAPVVPLVSLLAAASLYIYLVQFLVLSAFENDVVETAAALTAGCLVWWLADRPVRRLQDLIPPPVR
jgi:acyl-coenzyme A synthetase/AMP-(fatty) acid ligase